MTAGILQNSKEFWSKVESKHMDSIASVIFSPAETIQRQIAT